MCTKAYPILPAAPVTVTLIGALCIFASSKCLLRCASLLVDADESIKLKYDVRYSQITYALFVVHTNAFTLLNNVWSHLLRLHGLPDQIHEQIECTLLDVQSRMNDSEIIGFVHLYIPEYETHNALDVELNLVVCILEVMTIVIIVLQSHL